MTGDKNKFISLKKERDGSVSFGNDNSTIIIGKEIFHNYLSVSMRTKGLNGERYFMLFIDDYTRMISLSFIKKKS
jgi:hypothetical protein